MAFLVILTLAAGALTLLLMGLVGLWETPWPVLLAGLIFALYGLQRLAAVPSTSLRQPEESATPQANKAATPTRPQSSSPNSSSTDSSSSEPELIYRGVHYQPPSPPEPSPAEEQGDPIVLEGTYRGHHWRRTVTRWFKRDQNQASSESSESE